MKSISEYLIEQLSEAEDKVIDSSVGDSKDDAASSVDDSADDSKDDSVKEAEETIKNEKDFRAAAEAKFKTVFGDDLD